MPSARALEFGPHHTFTDAQSGTFCLGLTDMKSVTSSVAQKPWVVWQLRFHALSLLTVESLKLSALFCSFVKWANNV